MDFSTAYLLILYEFMESEFGPHYPTDVVHLIIMIYWDFFEIKIGCKTNHYVLLRDRKLYTWGSNGNGQLGHGDTQHRKSMQKIISCPKNIIDVVCGSSYFLALGSEGTIYSCGDNDLGQLGLGDTYDRYFLSLIENCDVKFIKIYCGFYHSVAITSEGKIYVWGFNHSGQLGLADIINRKNPCQNPFLSDILEISCGVYHNMALDSDGNVYAWGGNVYRQCRLDGPVRILSPQKIDLDGSIKISCGFYNSAILTSNGKIHIYGYAPSYFENKTIVDISYGNGHLMCLTNNGEIYAYGSNYHRQLGLDHSDYIFVRTKITDSRNIEKVYCADGYSIMITKFREIYVRGKNEGWLNGEGQNTFELQKLKLQF